MNYEKVGLLISKLRKEKGLTQKELADKLNITDRAVSKWERGLGCPDVSLLEDLSNILEVSILEILKGRRLDKDEITENKDLFELMNYSKESYKNKIKKYVNAVLIFSTIFTIILLLFYNLVSIYTFNKKYKNYDNLDAEKGQFTKYSSNIEIIKNNQGIYSDEDYKKILTYVDELNEKLNIVFDTELVSKKYYTYNEIKSYFIENYNNVNYKQIYYNDDSVYKILFNYNKEIIDKIVKYYHFKTSNVDMYPKMLLELKKPYYNGQVVSNILSEYLLLIINNNYYVENILLDDIIEIGDMNE